MSQEPKPTTAAEAAYQEYIARSKRSPDFDFASFCAQHEELGPELRRLHAHAVEAHARAMRPDADQREPHQGPQGGSRETDGSQQSRADTKASRYRMEGEIARGGMAAILKVWDADLRRTLAMKVILSETERIPDGSTAQIRLSRFLEEAQITGQLDHPGVVPVHELGADENGRVYFTMRLVKGDNFGEVINKVRAGTDGWNLTRAINVLHRVCETMAYAHSKGVVHRDLKPENVMVGRFGETYAMDWGVARLLDHPDVEAQRREAMQNASAFIVRPDRRGDAASEAATQTQAGSIMGTPCYMPPEQAAGEIETIGPQSDVYSVGTILYQLLTGTRPYAHVGHSTLAIVRAVLEGPPIPIHRLEPKVSPELAAICERAMARAPADRYPSMIEMAADLQAYLEGRVVHAYRTGAVAEFVKWVRRNRGVSAALAGLVFVTIAGLVALAWTQSTKAREIAQEQKLAHDARAAEVKSLERERRQGYFANVIAAHASLAVGETVEAKRYLADCHAELRGWEWEHLSLAADASIAVFDAQAGPITGFALDAAGDRLVVGVTEGSPRVFDVAARSLPLVLQDDPSDGKALNAPVVAFLDGGRTVAAFGRQDERMRVWNAMSGSIQDNLPLPTRALYAIAVSPLGNRVALGAADHSIRIVDPRTGEEVGRLEGHPDTVLAMTFSADGSRLASGSEDGTARIWSIADVQPVGAAIKTSTAVRSVALSPTGAELALGLEDGSIWRFRMDGSTIGQLTGPDGRGHQGTVYGLAYHRDGTRLVSASFDKTLRVWSTADARLLRVMRGHGQSVNRVQFTPKGSTLVSGSGDGSVRLWDADRNRATISYKSRDALLGAVDITRDGRLVAVGSTWPGNVEILDAESGDSQLVVSGGPQDSVVAVAFSPLGERLAVALREECSLRICEVANGKLGAPLLGHEASLTSIAWSPDGKMLASGSEDHFVRRWNAERGEAIGTPWDNGEAVTAVAFSPDGKRVAAGARDGTIRVWDVDTNTKVLEIRSESKAVLALAYAPEGGALAAGYHEGVIRIFGPDKTEPDLTLVGHDRMINSLRYLLDGQRLVSGSSDHTVRLWDASTGRLVLALREHSKQVTGVAAGGTKARIVSASHDGTVQIRQARRDAQASGR